MAWEGRSVQWRTHESPRTTWRSQFSPSTAWIFEIELWSPGLAASILPTSPSRQPKARVCLMKQQGTETLWGWKPEIQVLYGQMASDVYSHVCRTVMETEHPCVLRNERPLCWVQHAPPRASIRLSTAEAWILLVWKLTSGSPVSTCPAADAVLTTLETASLLSWDCEK